MIIKKAKRIYKMVKTKKFFTKNSSIVKSWVTLVTSGVYAIDKVPNLFNLKEVVQEVLDELAKETEILTEEDKEA